MGRKRGLEALPGFLRTYKTEKFIRVDVPRVGVFFRVCQLLAFLLVFAQLYLNDGWALAEEPAGIANAWDEPGSYFTVTDDVDALRSSAEYCNNANYSFVSETYKFTGTSGPACEVLLPAELTTKTAGSVFYTTSILETVTTGWPCSAGDSSTRKEACVQDGGTHFARKSGQCGCFLERALYPMAVEDLLLAIEHSYDTTLVGLSGASANKNSDLYSIVVFANGSRVRYEQGQVVRMSVRDWIAAGNETLHQRNYAVVPDSSGRYPTQRTSGINFKVELEYSNIDLATNKPVPGKTDVHAHIRVSAEHGTWTGAGTESIWVKYPTESRDLPQEYQLIQRQKHGVLFQFHTTGLVYKFDIFYLLGVVVSALVLLKVANSLTNFYAFNCLGAESVVLRNTRTELASKKEEFAEIGLKAALAAAAYPKFDRFCDGTIEAEDITRVFAQVDGVPWETAYMISRNILNNADTEPSLGGEQSGLNFVEFMTCLEGDAINFQAFLEDTKKMYDDRIVEQAEEDAEDAEEEAKKKGKGKAVPPPKQPAGPSLKQKMKAERLAAKKKAADRKAAIETLEKKLQAEAEAAGKDFDEFMDDKERAEDQAMRERCRTAYDEQKALQSENASADPNRKQRKTAAADDAVSPAAKPETPAVDAVVAAAPAAGASLGLDEEKKEERLGKRGTLRVQLASASGLQAADKDGLADPYIIAKLGKKEKASTVCEKTLTPQWDETLELVTKLSLKKVIKDGLSLKVVDKDKGLLDRDDVMGNVTADLSALETSDTISFAESVSTGGVLKFTVAWEEGEAATPKKSKKDKKEGADTDEGPRAEAALEAPANAADEDVKQTL